MGAAVAPDGLDAPRRHWAALAIFLALILVVVDGMIANVALPSIRRNLGISAASAVWVINASSLAMAICILPLATLGERVGYRRIYLIGLGVFTAGALGSACAQSLEQLIAARVMQGLGGAGIMGVNAALVRFTYPKALLGRGIGTNAAVIAIASAFGPSLASIVIAVADWRWAFAINAPLGLVAIVLGIRSLPGNARGQRPFNITAALLSALAVGLVVLGVDHLLREGSAIGAVMLASGVASGALLIWRERAEATPFVPIDVLRNPVISLAVLAQFLATAAWAMAYVGMPFDLQGRLGRSIAETGLLLMPWPIAAALAAPLSSRAAERYSEGILGFLGLSLMGAGLVLLAMLPAQPAALWIATPMFICGFGYGLFQTPNNRAIFLTVPIARTGATGGLVAATRLLGHVLGAGTLGILFHFAEDEAVRLALFTAAGIALSGAAVSLLRRKPVTP